MAENCHQCKFFVPHDVMSRYGAQENQGDCRRRSPVIKQNHGTWGEFPIVDENVWCGEFKSKNELDKVIDAIESKGALEEKPYGHIEE